MRVSMRADGRTSYLRCTLVETIDLGGMVEFEVDPHIVISGVETTAETGLLE